MNTLKSDVLFAMKSSVIHQLPDNIQIPAEITKNTTKEELLDILKELDRRCYQLWDKISYEKNNNLVKYNT